MKKSQRMLDEEDVRSVAFRRSVRGWAMASKRRLKAMIAEGETRAWTEEQLNLLEIMKGCAENIPI